MNKVVTISLSGNAYQLEEGGYDALRAYLDAARSKLAGNPDSDEILRDLEQAIAEKLTRLMNAHATVATGANVAQALGEMGPVNTAGVEETARSKTESEYPKRLYLIREGAVISGVCKGLAAYLNLDVLVVRIAFVALTLLTGGAWILLYVVMMLFVPYADTPEKISRATGTPWNAQEILDRTRQGIAELKKNGNEWKRHMKQERQEVRWEARRQRACAHHYHHHSAIGDLVELAILGAIIWAAYTYIPATHPYYERVGTDIQQGWAWLNAKVAR